MAKIGRIPIPSLLKDPTSLVYYLISVFEFGIACDVKDVLIAYVAVSMSGIVDDADTRAGAEDKLDLVLSESLNC